MDEALACTVETAVSMRIVSPVSSVQRLADLDVPVYDTDAGLRRLETDIAAHTMAIHGLQAAPAAHIWWEPRTSLPEVRWLENKEDTT